MRLPSTPTLSVINHLNTTYFHELWNATGDHAQANFPLPKASARLSVGALPINLSVVGLPTADTVYAVYRVAPSVFGRFLVLPRDQWVTDDALIASQGISLLTYASSGRCVPTGTISLRYDTARDMVLVAINKTYTSACIGVSYPDLYMTVYKDTSRQTPIIRFVYQIKLNGINVVTTNNVMTAIAIAQFNCPHGTIVYVNGWLYAPGDVPSLNNGDIIEIVQDPDIVGSCDITIDDNQTGYHSDLYGEYREILHLPKALNPNNVVITHDTLMMAIIDPSTGRGVYGHRLDPHALESITHNDFSIGHTALQAYQTILGAQTVKVRLYVRYPTKQLTLTQEVNHLQELYLLDDTDILLQLAGLAAPQIPQWKASHLESSAYLNLLYQFGGYDPQTAIPNFANAVGYYDVASTLSQAMHFYTYTGSQVIITKPTRLQGYPCSAIVYADGRKIPNYALGITDHSGDSFTLGFTTDSWVEIGSKISVYVIESGLRTMLSWNPTVAQPSITLSSDDYILVQLFSYQTPKAVWQNLVNSGYLPLSFSPGDYHVTANPDRSYTFTASAIHYGQSFLLVPSCGLTTATYFLDAILDAKQPIIIDLQGRDPTNQLLPLIAYQTVEIYVNGFRLIEGIDYKLSQVLGDNNDVLQTLLQVSNADYLTPTIPGNMLEVVVHGDKSINDDKGYVFNNRLPRHTAPMTWNAPCGRAYVSGRLINNLTNAIDALVSPTLLADGAPYLLEWSLPYGVAKLMTGLSPNTDDDLQAAVLSLLNLELPPVYPTTISIYHLFSLYSPYLARIITDVANGLFLIVNEPRDDLFLNQFYQYKLLLQGDPTLGTSNNLIDRRFCTIAAHYANFTITDAHQMLLVQRLITLLLTPSSLAINEVLV